jgi:hypothetical protein
MTWQESERVRTSGALAAQPGPKSLRSSSVVKVGAHSRVTSALPRRRIQSATLSGGATSQPPDHRLMNTIFPGCRLARADDRARPSRRRPVIGRGLGLCGSVVGLFGPDAALVAAGTSRVFSDADCASPPAGVSPSRGRP